LLNLNSQDNLFSVCKSNLAASLELCTKWNGFVVKKTDVFFILTWLFLIIIFITSTL
jgi:hypothetical protein